MDGFSLHAATCVHANDRQGLEHLCRYLLRPAFALSRLSGGEDGRLVYRMKRPRDEELYLVLTPDELLARLATLVPPPRSHGVRYHGDAGEDDAEAALGVEAAEDAIGHAGPP